MYFYAPNWVYDICFTIKYSAHSRERTYMYVMITYVSKENNLGPGDKIRCIWGHKGPILFCKAQLVHTNFLYPYQMLSFYEIKSFTRALGIMVSVPKCPGKWFYTSLPLFPSG